MLSEEKDIRNGRGHGYHTTKDTIHMVRCFECGRENWAMAVASGQCAWCGFNANKEEIKNYDEE
jgi:ribosomal protein L37E